MPLFLPKHHGVLGINARNFTYLRPYNPAKAVAFADDKLKTKMFLETRGIPVPKLYAKIPSREALRAFDFRTLPDACVLKPNFGYGGEGILVLVKRDHNGFVTATGEKISYEELLEHCENILEGMYSLNHRRDTAFFEQILLPADVLAPLKPTGLPDIRIIVFNLVPVMAMLRIPTAESGGKANVHLGGIGLGIDIAKGMTTFGVQRDHRIHTLPDGHPIAGFKIPRWEEMLLIASRIQHITNIGFLGVDLIIDPDAGPMLLEVNARAGLMVQIANLAPLGQRLERVAGLKVGSPAKGVRIAQDLFGEKVTEKRSAMHGERPVLATQEPIEILGGKKSVCVPAVLRPDFDRTVFDPSLIAELRLLDAVEEDKDETFRVKFVLGGKKIQTVVRSVEVTEEDPAVRASLGRRDLAGFLVDPGKKPSYPLHPTIDLVRIDRQLADIDRKIHLLQHLRPENLEEERRRALADASYNPVFTYEELSFDPAELRDRLSYLEADRSPLGILLEKKRQEILQKIALLEARGKNASLTSVSRLLFGEPDAALLEAARESLRSWKKEKAEAPEKFSSAIETKKRFEAALKSYGLRDWSVELRAVGVADVSIGKKTILLREDSHFSEERLQSLIAHEIEVHVLTAENGMKQPYELFERGMAGSLTTQEGLAVFRQNLVLSAHHEKRYWPAMNALAVHEGLTHSFAELRSFIRHLGFDDVRALRTCFKIKRGMGKTANPGAFTKEVVYFRGWQLVSSYVESGGDLKELYRGKINLRDLDLVRKVEGLIDPVYVPREG